MFESLNMGKFPVLLLFDCLMKKRPELFIVSLSNHVISHALVYHLSYIFHLHSRRDTVFLIENVYSLVIIIFFRLIFSLFPLFMAFQSVCFADCLPSLPDTFSNSHLLPSPSLFLFFLLMIVIFNSRFAIWSPAVHHVLRAFTRSGSFRNLSQSLSSARRDVL